MTEDRAGRPDRISRRSFLKVGGEGAVVAALLSACKGLPGREPLACYYENDKTGWLEDARKYEVWKELVGKENPHADEGYSLVFAGGVYIPPEVGYFRTTPFKQRDYEITGIVTTSGMNHPDNNVIGKDTSADGVLVINPVVVEGWSATTETSENSFSIPAPNGSGVENIKNINHMWVAMATRPLLEAKVIGSDPLSASEVGVGSAVTFANISLGSHVELIPAGGQGSGRPVLYDGSEGLWGYARILRRPVKDANEKQDWADPGEDAVRWDGLAKLENPKGEAGIVRVGEIVIVRDLKEAQEVMKQRKSS